MSIGTRIAEARERRGVTQGQLGEHIGRNASAISRIESGARKVDGYELARIAGFLNVDVRQLLGIKAETPALVLAARVAEAANTDVAKDPAATVSAILEVEGVLDQLGVEESSRELLVVVPSDDPDPVKAGETTAALVREAAGLGSAPLPAALPSWVEAHFKVDVIGTPLSEGVAGLCVRAEERSIAVINRDDYVARQRFTLAHELAHHLFQDGDTLIPDSNDRMFSNEDPQETRASAFAAELLVPAALLRKRFHSDTPAESMIELMLETRASKQTVVYRLHNTGLINAEQRDWLLSESQSKWIRRLGRRQEWAEFRSSEGQDRPPARIVERVVNAYEEGLVGIGPVAEVCLRLGDRERLRAELEEDGIAPKL